MRYYRIQQRFHLGDQWARMNFALRLLEAGEVFSLVIDHSIAQEILAALQIHPLARPFPSERPRGSKRCRRLDSHINDHANAYRVRYLPTVLGHSPRRGRIGLALQANWHRKRKIPPGLDGMVEQLKQLFPECVFVPIGLPHQQTVTEVIEALSGLELLLAVDNGIAQIARSVGVPLFLVEHVHPLDRGFPTTVCRYRRVTVESLVEDIAGFLRADRPSS